MIKIGDWVCVKTQNGQKITKALQGENDFLKNEQLFEGISNDDVVFGAQVQILTLTDFFEIIGKPVPEGAKIVLDYGMGDGYLVVLWAYILNEDYWNFFDGSVAQGDASEDSYQMFSPDLSRLPMADAWDAIPLSAQKLFLEKVNK